MLLSCVPQTRPQDAYVRGTHVYVVLAVILVQVTEGTVDNRCAHSGFTMCARSGFT